MPQLRSCNCLIGPRPLSSLAYNAITHTPLVAGNLPIKTLVAMAVANKLYRGWLCVCIMDFVMIINYDLLYSRALIHYVCYLNEYIKVKLQTEL